MRKKIIEKLKNNKLLLTVVYNCLRTILNLIDLFIPKRKKILFSSFGGRNFDDSPYALYKKIISDRRFEQYELVWAFVEPENHVLPKGRKIKIDTFGFFCELLSSKIWISNAGIDRGIELSRKRHISVETWHGTPLKKIADDSNNEQALNENKLRKQDSITIRCAQSEYDLNIFCRIFNASRDSFLLCDLPRNDELLSFSDTDKAEIRSKLGISADKKIILYMPTYREYLMTDDEKYYLAPPISLEKWEKFLNDDYVFLIRAHYAVNAALNVVENSFVKNVSNYPHLNELYAVCDIFISDYSSSFIDCSILDKPMLCFPYDYDTYSKKRGLYIDLSSELPCDLCFDEDSLLDKIKNMDIKIASEKTKEFHKKFAPYAGNACETVLDEVFKRLNH